MEPLQISSINSAGLNIINPERVIDNNVKIKVDEDSAKLNLKTQVETNSQSEFSNKLTDSISRISDLQNVQSTINSQIGIVNEINLNIQNSNSVELLDNIQPTIKNLMNDFNHSSELIDLSQIILDQESEDSTAYFDGILGSKPLSPLKIMEATESKMRLLESVRSNTTDSYETAVNDVKNTISQERQVSQEKSPFEGINFGKESSDFSSTTINSTVGSIAVSQANPSSTHTIRLLTQ